MREKSKAKKSNQEYVRPTDPSLYIGSETCKSCHEDMPTSGFYKTFVGFTLLGAGSLLYLYSVVSIRE
jgi:hypothetical protein